MKSPKIPQVNLPYASTVASFFGDQGAAQGNSFLGRLFRGGGRSTVTQTQGGARNAGSGLAVRTSVAGPPGGSTLPNTASLRGY